MELVKFLSEIGALSYPEWRKELASHPVGKMIVDDLEMIPQPIKWHPEYCTLKHTYLVCLGIFKSGKEFHRLLPAALFHDWGKVNTTLIQRSKISALGHAKESKRLMLENESLIRSYLVMNDKEWNDLLWLVERHMDFDPGHKRFMNPEKYEEPYSDLEVLVKADKLFSRDAYFTNIEDNYDDNVILHDKELQSYQMFSKDIFMTVGIPGCGKSTFLNETFYTHLSIGKDDIRREVLGDINDNSKSNSGLVNREYIKRANKILNDYELVVLDETGLFTQNIHKTLSKLPQVRRTAFVFESNPEVSKMRIRKDIQEGKDRSNVPEKVIDKFFKDYKRQWRKRFPEFHRVYFLTNIKENNILEIYNKDRGIDMIDQIGKEKGYV